MGVLALLFIVVPAVELALLIEIGGQIGGLRTLLLIVATGIIGASLAKRAGLDVLRRINAETAAGRLPAGALVDGAIVLVAGALLVTPGILTDVFGFACLVPGIRGVMKRLAVRRFERAVAEGKVNVGGFGPAGPAGPGPGPGGPGGPFAGPRPARRPAPGGGPVIDVTPPTQPETSDRQGPHGS